MYFQLHYCSSFPHASILLAKEKFCESKDRFNHTLWIVYEQAGSRSHVASKRKGRFLPFSLEPIIFRFKWIRQCSETKRGRCVREAPGNKFLHWKFTTHLIIYPCIVVPKETNILKTTIIQSLIECLHECKISWQTTLLRMGVKNFIKFTNTTPSF